MEAHRESNTTIFRWGKRFCSSSRASWALWQVPLRPEEKAMYSTSWPASSRGVNTRRNSSELIWVVVDMAPPRSLA